MGTREALLRVWIAAGVVILGLSLIAVGAVTGR